MGQVNLNKLIYKSEFTNLWWLDLYYNQISGISPLVSLTNLCVLYLDNNQILDILPLSNLTQLGDLSGLSDDDLRYVESREGIYIHLGLSGNLISNVQPLVDNSGLDDGDGIDLRSNTLSADSLNIYIPQLEARGVEVLYDEDTTPPTISSVSPEDSATDVNVSTNVTVTFSEAMDSSTITTDSFTLAGSPVSGTVTYDPSAYTATFTPDANLDYNYEYTATLTTAITDLAGNPLAEPYTWSFTTIQLAWESYKTSTCTEVWGTNSTTQYSDSYHTAYMRGEGFNDTSEYTVGYYDGGDIKVQSEPRSSSGGELLSQYDLTTGSSAIAGTWHSVVFETTGPIPSAYGDVEADPSYVVDDDFIVGASAIPEFPTVMAGIGVAGLCFGIYYWMRRKAAWVSG